MQSKESARHISQTRIQSAPPPPASPAPLKQSVCLARAHSEVTCGNSHSSTYFQPVIEAAHDVLSLAVQDTYKCCVTGANYLARGTSDTLSNVKTLAPKVFDATVSTAKKGIRLASDGISYTYRSPTTQKILQQTVQIASDIRSDAHDIVSASLGVANATYAQATNTLWQTSNDLVNRTQHLPSEITHIASQIIDNALDTAEENIIPAIGTITQGATDVALTASEKLVHIYEQGKDPIASAHSTAVQACEFVVGTVVIGTATDVSSQIPEEYMEAAENALKNIKYYLTPQSTVTVQEPEEDEYVVVSLE